MIKSFERPQNSKIKYFRIRTLRIILSLCLPVIFGAVIYSIFSGLYQEALFWIAFFTTMPGLLLIALIPSLIYTLLMEFLGKKLIQNKQNSDKRFLNYLIFLATGTSLTNLYVAVSDMKTSIMWHFMIAITGLTVTGLKLLLHLKESQIGKSD